MNYTHKRAHKRRGGTSAYKRRRGPQSRAIIIARPGYSRVVGNYGRFSPAGGEMKWFNQLIATVTLGVTGNSIKNSINLVDQGNAEDNMIGRKITIKSIQFRGRFELPSDSNGVLANLTSSDNYRVMLILDKQANGTSPSWNTVFQSDSAADLFGYNNLENSTRFTIIKEWSGNVTAEALNNDAMSAFASPLTTQHFKWFKKVNIPIEMGVQAGGSRVVGEVKSNNLFLIGVSEFGQIVIKGNTRIRYTDA